MCYVLYLNGYIDICLYLCVDMNNDCSYHKLIILNYMIDIFIGMRMKLL